ncbi:MAG: hypothetical protein KTR30_03265 [Saprospiraceae bacterium]|nr:hypothetical protein [Saprospiraceae bacterium]
MMKNINNSPRRNGGSLLLKSLGFLFAVILFVGMMDKAGVNISLDDQGAASTQVAHAAVGEKPAMETPPSSATRNRIIVADEPEVRPTRSYSTPKSYDVSNSSSKRKGLDRSITVEDWIAGFSDLAVEQAMDRGIPAGVALAVGVSKIKDGVNISNWNSFMEEVIEPLAAAKFQASRKQIKSYFKYSANSEKWAEGLGNTGDFSASGLKKVMKKYALRDFDYEVRNKLSSDPEVEKRAREVAEEVTYAMKESRWEARKEAVANRSKAREMKSAEIWEAEYDEMVGREVAKKIAKEKLKSNSYISEEDMARLVEETNVETSKVLENKLSFPGRKVNKDHPDATKMKDITNPKNSQAREELYQKKLKARKASRKKERS